MRLFLKHNLIYIVFYLIMISITPIYAKGGGFTSSSGTKYYIFLTLTIITIMLIIKYLKEKMLYSRLKKNSNTLEETLVSSGNSVLAKEVDRILEEQYKIYKSDIETYQLKFREHEDFINLWVHQMKTPISVIQLIISEDEFNEQFSSIGEQVEKLNRGLRTALNLSRLESFTEDFKVEKVNLKKAITEEVNNQKSYFIKKGVFPKLNIDENIFVYTDYKWIKFIIEQILINSIKYSSSGEKVSINVFKEDFNKNKVILEIKDNGVGISKKDLKRVFEPFYTGENGRKFGESTGMGLYMVKKLCDKLKHNIKIESEEKRGTDITIIFEKIVK